MGSERCISDSDWITKVHVCVVGPGTYDACYETLRRIDPFLESEEWQWATSGHYLSIIKKAAGRALRIAFFAPTERESHCAKAMIDVQVEQIGATLLLYEPPTQEVFSQSYGGVESHFRSYLAAYSQIVVEIIREKGVEYSRQLFALFRFRVVTARCSARGFLEPVFKNIPTYTSLDNAQRDQFWKAVDFEKPGSTPWVHMLVNLGLGADWPYQYGQEWPLDRINGRLTDSGMGYTIPHDWQP